MPRKSHGPGALRCGDPVNKGGRNGHVQGPVWPEPGEVDPVAVSFEDGAREIHEAATLTDGRAR